MTRRWIPAAIVASVAAFGAFRGLEQEPFISDESMWIHIGQKTWPMFRSGDWQSPEWANMDATWGYVNPPIAKYILGISVGDVPYRWKAGVVPEEGVLLAGRRPSALLGVLGALALLGIGWRILTPAAGTIAALILAASPLWIVVSRHAMTDVYGVTLSLLAVLAFLPGLAELRGERRAARIVLWFLISGVIAGLAVGAKLNAAMTPVFLGVVLLLVLVRGFFRDDAGGRASGWVLLSGALFAGAAVATFVGLNPYLHEETIPRFTGMLDFWRDMGVARAERAAEGGFGRAFLPEEAGLRTLTSKFVGPTKARGWLLAAPLAVGLGLRLVPGWHPRRARLVTWALLVPAAAFLATAPNQLLHGWPAWAGLLGAITTLPLDPGSGRARRFGAATDFLLPVWVVTVTYLLWKNSYLPQDRYYLPLVPVACLLAGSAWAALREDVSGVRSWPRSCIDTALAAGVVSVLAAFPAHDGAGLKGLFSDGTWLSRGLFWVSAAAMQAGILAALFTRRTAPAGDTE